MEVLSDMKKQALLALPRENMLRLHNIEFPLLRSFGTFQLPLLVFTFNT